MLSIICMLIGTISVLLFIIMLNKGKRYNALVVNLEENEYQLKDLYTVGFAWGETVSLLSFSGPLSKKIRTNVALLYGEKYVEFYTRITLAKAYTYAHLGFCFFTGLSGMVSGSSSVLLVVVGAVMSVATVMIVIEEPKNKVKSRADDYLLEFPNVVTKLALMIESGMILRDAWVYVAGTTKGQLRNAMEHTCDLMRNGYSDMDAIYYFGQYSGTKEMKKFASSIVQGISKGNSELASILMQQSSELWEIKRQRLLQKGEEAATKLVIPTTMMFAGIIMVILVSAMSGMSL